MGLQRREFLSLIGASAVGTVVLTACGKFGGAARVEGPTIGMLQMLDAPPPNNTRKGFEAALAEAGYLPGETANFIQKDAAGEMPNTTLVMKQFVGDQVDMILAVGTPPLQAAMKEAPETTPVIFCYCSNPWGAGAGTPPEVLVSTGPMWWARSAPTRWARSWIWPAGLTQSSRPWG
jgi:putative tryptophan/tyrosine transport system substrate-binding protein